MGIWDSQNHLHNTFLSLHVSYEYTSFSKIHHYRCHSYYADRFHRLLCTQKERYWPQHLDLEICPSCDYYYYHSNTHQFSSPFCTQKITKIPSAGREFFCKIYSSLFLFKICTLRRKVSPYVSKFLIFLFIDYFVSVYIIKYHRFSVSLDSNKVF